MDTSTKPSVVMRDAAIAAAHQAVTAAVVNAAKPGRKTSEFWTSILLPAAATIGVTALKVFGVAAAASMPWLSIPVVAGAAALTAFGYSASRGNVKAAALDAAGAAIQAAGDASPTVKEAAQLAGALGVPIPGAPGLIAGTK